jgi:hypothetical protein
MERNSRLLGVNGEALSVNAWRLREDTFFQTVGVDGTITVYGQTLRMWSFPQALSVSITASGTWKNSAS